MWMLHVHLVIVVTSTGSASVVNVIGLGVFLFVLKPMWDQWMCFAASRKNLKKGASKNNA